MKKQYSGIERLSRNRLRLKLLSLTSNYLNKIMKIPSYMGVRGLYPFTHSIILGIMFFPKKQKPLSKSNRQKSGQKEVFADIWEERPHYCVVCWWYIPLPLSFVFAHWLSKWVNPEYKFDKRTIFLVDTLDCHHELDLLLAHQSPWFILSLNEILDPLNGLTLRSEKFGLWKKKPKS